jgi:hypothetical protein
MSNCGQGDISDSDVESCHTRRNSASSSPSAPSSITTRTPSETPRVGVPISLEIPGSLLKSPSSPNILNAHVTSRPTASRALTRSNTLPHVSEEKSPYRRRISELRGLVVDAEILVHMRQWILGFVIGNFKLYQG